jgi:transposase
MTVASTYTPAPWSVGIPDQAGEIVVHRHLQASPDALLKIIAPYRDDLSSLSSACSRGTWLADLCAQEGISFVLGHALYMKAIHGGKAKNDRVDAYKIAALLRGGMFPLAYAYPAEWRATRDLLRRRMYLMRQRADLLSHVQNTNSQYNLPELGKKIAYKANREGVAERFPDPMVQQTVAVDLKLIDYLDEELRALELTLVRQAKAHDAHVFHLLRSVPGIGKILALVLLYEIHDIARFPTVGDFVSYCRVVKCAKESGGKKYGYTGKKIGNAYLKWAFSEAAVLFLRANPDGQRYVDRLTRKYGKAKALTVLAHRLARAVYHMLQRRTPFDQKRFLATA